MFKIRRNRIKYAIAVARAREWAVHEGIDSGHESDRRRAHLQQAYEVYGETRGKSYSKSAALASWGATVLTGASLGYLASHPVLGGVAGLIAGSPLCGGAINTYLSEARRIQNKRKENISRREEESGIKRKITARQTKSVSRVIGNRIQSSPGTGCLDAKLSSGAAA